MVTIAQRDRRTGGVAVDRGLDRVRNPALPREAEQTLADLERRCGELAVIAGGVNLRYVGYLLQIAAQEVAASRSRRG